MYVDVYALLPRIALPVRDTRERLFGDAAAVRAVTLRADVARDETGAVAVRDTTLRDATAREDVADGAAVVVRTFVAARDAFPRADTLRDDVVVVGAALVVRATVAGAAFPRGLAMREDARDDAAARGDCAVICTASYTGATGSANTARIETNVEQTKNAPTSKNTVPTAFLQKSATLRLFINTLLFSGNARKPVDFKLRNKCCAPFL